jgi:hypothetical protein
MESYLVNAGGIGLSGSIAKQRREKDAEFEGSSNHHRYHETGERALFA